MNPNHNGDSTARLGQGGARGVNDVQDLWSPERPRPFKVRLKKKGLGVI